MLFSDVNILVHAIRPRVAPDGVAVRNWFLDALGGRESVGIGDAVLASIALEQGATFVTLDRGFNRFDGLRTFNPLA